MTPKAGNRLVGGGIEQKGKRTHEHGQLCGDCRGINSNGKNAIKYFFKKNADVIMLLISSSESQIIQAGAMKSQRSLRVEERGRRGG